MPFSEAIKKEAKRRANYRCVICQTAFVEVHHILPEADGGPDTIENAAPLCGGCHQRYGGNPELRKQLREIRDHWWERCADAKYLTVDAGLAQKVDDLRVAMLQGQKRQEDVLGEVKGLFLAQINLAQQQVMASGSLSGVITAVSSLGNGLPPFGLEQEEPWVGQMQKNRWQATVFRDDEVLPTPRDSSSDKPTVP